MKEQLPTIPAEGTVAVPTPDAYRAYQRWRGGEHGHDREDWLETERELQGTAGRESARYRFLQQAPSDAT